MRLSSDAKFGLGMIGVIALFVLLMSALISSADSYNEVTDERGCHIINSTDNRFGLHGETYHVETHCPVKAK